MQFTEHGVTYPSWEWRSPMLVKRIPVFIRECLKDCPIGNELTLTKRIKLFLLVIITYLSANRLHDYSNRKDRMNVIANKHSHARLSLNFAQVRISVKSAQHAYHRPYNFAYDWVSWINSQIQSQNVYSNDNILWTTSCKNIENGSSIIHSGVSTKYNGNSTSVAAV